MTEYMIELTTNAREFFRPHFFVNTPDIKPGLPADLRTAGVPDSRGACRHSFGTVRRL